MPVPGGVDLPADIGVDLPNLNSSWPLDVSSRGSKSAGRSRGRSAKFELILTTRCQFWGVDLPNLNSSWPLDVSSRGSKSAGRSRGRSTKFELILTTRCQFCGVDLPNLNSSWPLDFSSGGVDLPADLGVGLPNLSTPDVLGVLTKKVFSLRLGPIRNYVTTYQNRCNAPNENGLKKNVHFRLFCWYLVPSRYLGQQWARWQDPGYGKHTVVLLAYRSVVWSDCIALHAILALAISYYNDWATCLRPVDCVQSIAQGIETITGPNTEPCRFIRVVCKMENVGPPCGTISRPFAFPLKCNNVDCP